MSGVTAKVRAPGMIQVLYSHGLKACKTCILLTNHVNVDRVRQNNVAP